MPRKPHPGHVDEALRRRTELAIRLAHDWMDAMNASQRGLAERLQVDQSVLSRFLSQQPGYEPAPTRPRILKLLEDIEQFCSHVENVALWIDDEFFAPDDDLRVLFRAHTARLRQLRQMPDPAEALVRLPELSAQALLFPDPYALYACANTLLGISVLSYSLRAQIACSQALLKNTSIRIDRLAEGAFAALERGVGMPEEDRARILSYQGTSQSYIGLATADTELLQSGVRRALDAVLYQNRPLNGVWLNVVQLLEHVLEIGHPLARTFSEEALKRAQSYENEALRMAMVERSMERVRSHWRELAPRFVEGICGSAR